MSKAKAFLKEAGYSFWGDNPKLKKAMDTVTTAMNEVDSILKDVTSDLISDQGKTPDEVLKFTSHFISVLQRNIDIKMDDLKKSFRKGKEG